MRTSASPGPGRRQRRRRISPRPGPAPRTRGASVLHRPLPPGPVEPGAATVRATCCTPDQRRSGAPGSTAPALAARRARRGGRARRAAGSGRRAGRWDWSARRATGLVLLDRACSRMVGPARARRPGDPGPATCSSAASPRWWRRHRPVAGGACSSPWPRSAWCWTGWTAQVARRTGTASAFGARFDMEVDAFLILVLSVYVARPLGAWVLAIGLARYVLLLAERLLPWLRRPVPAAALGQGRRRHPGRGADRRRGRRAARTGDRAVLVLALGLLAESFGRQVVVAVAAPRCPHGVRGRGADVTAGCGVRPGVLTVLALVLVWVALVAPGPARPARPAASSGCRSRPVLVGAARPGPARRAGPRRAGRARRSLLGAGDVLKVLDIGFSRPGPALRPGRSTGVRRVGRSACSATRSVRRRGRCCSSLGGCSPAGAAGADAAGRAAAGPGRRAGTGRPRCGGVVRSPVWVLGAVLGVHVGAGAPSPRPTPRRTPTPR